MAVKNTVTLCVHVLICAEVAVIINLFFYFASQNSHHRHWHKLFQDKLRCKKLIHLCLLPCIHGKEDLWWLVDMSITYGEGSGTPLQHSCLENPMDWGAWCAAVHGVEKGRTRLSDFPFTFFFFFNFFSLSLLTLTHWRRKWQPTPVFLPGESQGWGSLVGCRLWGCTEADTTEAT